MTDIPIGKFAASTFNDLGFQYYDANNNLVEIKNGIDQNNATSIIFKPNEQLTLFLDKEDGKVPYPLNGIYISNGNNSIKSNRIRNIEISYEQKKIIKSWTFELQDTLQFQYLRIPEVIFLGQKSKLILKPTTFYPNVEVGEFSELYLDIE